MSGFVILVVLLVVLALLCAPRMRAAHGGRNPRMSEERKQAMLMNARKRCRRRLQELPKEIQEIQKQIHEKSLKITKTALSDDMAEALQDVYGTSDLDKVILDAKRNLLAKKQAEYEEVKEKVESNGFC